jgi:hypothetical protein
LLLALQVPGSDLRVIMQERNRGKGAALRRVSRRPAARSFSCRTPTSSTTRPMLQQIQLREDRFGFEAEVTAKVARAGWRVYEVPISYHGRTYAEGTKITWKDGVRGVWCTLRYGVLR